MSRPTREPSRSHCLKLWHVHNPPPRGHNMIVDLLQYSDLAAFLRGDEANTVRHTCKRNQQDPLLAKRVTPAAREAEFYQDNRDEFLELFGVD